VRDIKPGEMVTVTSKGIESSFPFEPQKSRFCIFEYVYFARPDSSVEGRNVYDVRKRIGAELAIESPVEADITVPVPVPARRRRSALRSRPTSPSSSASSATTMSGAPSSSRAIRSATWACGSSTTPTGG
jgi:hypothetical protein